MTTEEHKIGIDIEVHPDIVEALKADTTKLTERIGELMKMRSEIVASLSKIANIGERAHNAMLRPDGESELTRASGEGCRLKSRLASIAGNELYCELERRHTDMWVRYKR